jgi:putative two-component system response regulator
MELNYSLLTEGVNILVVDDTPANLALLTRMLKDCGYQARPVPNGRLALQAARQQPPDLILLDITMPEMDGYEVCRRLKQDSQLREVPVIFISALSETSEKVRAFSEGGVDYVTKPFQFEEVRARIETHLHLHRLQRDLRGQVEKQVKEISDSQMGMIFALAKLAETRDPETGRHLERIQILCQMLAEQLRRQARCADEVDAAFCARIFYASPLHDIGKVGIQDQVLLKPGKLTPEEFRVMQTHAEIGARTLEDVQRRFPSNTFLKMGIQIARSHHEKWNGTGYPDGLSGEHIPLCARIMAVADVYDALRARRVYKPPVTHAEVCAIFQRDSGTHFDPMLIESFQQLSDQFSEVWALHQE